MFYTDPEMFPSLTRAPHKRQEGLEGRWIYEEGTITKPTFEVKLYFFSMEEEEQEENRFRGVFNLVNLVVFGLKVQADGLCIILGGMRTLKKGSREMMEAESDFSKLLRQPGLHAQVSGDTLVITGPDESFRLVWKRAYFIPEIVTENPLVPDSPE